MNDTERLKIAIEAIEKCVEAGHCLDCSRNNILRICPIIYAHQLLGLTPNANIKSKLAESAEKIG